MINHPVQELQVRMKHISEGIFERDSSIEWQHELGDIGRSINDLAEDVKTLMDQRIRDENEKREYEYKMLQSQINPQFSLQHAQFHQMDGNDPECAWHRGDDDGTLQTFKNIARDRKVGSALCRTLPSG